MRIVSPGGEALLACRRVSDNSIHVVGARPNFMKAAPVIRALERRGIEPILVHTGQHYDARLSDIFFEQLQLPRPHHYLGVGSGSHAEQTAALLLALEKLFLEVRPERVVVYGDVNSTLAAAVTASKLEIPIAHVEAGLRSFDRSMPEEINRVVTDSLSNLHFVTSPEAIGNLAREGVSVSSIHFVGNPMIDTLLAFQERFEADRIREELGIEGPYGVVTLHRPSNVDDAEAAARVVECLRRASKRVTLIAPLHPRGRARLEAAGISQVAQVVEPLGYLDFMSLVSGASVVLTDSGGIQEETSVLGIPCLTLRENTERPITLSQGTNRLVGTDPDAVDEAMHDLGSLQGRGVPPLWDGRAGERIAQVLADEISDAGSRR